MIANAMENTDHPSEVQSMTGSPPPAQHEEACWEDDFSHEFRASLPRPGIEQSAAPEAEGIPEAPNWDDDLAYHAQQNDYIHNSFF